MWASVFILQWPVPADVRAPAPARNPHTGDTWWGGTQSLVHQLFLQCFLVLSTNISNILLLQYIFCNNVKQTLLSKLSNTNCICSILQTVCGTERPSVTGTWWRTSTGGGSRWSAPRPGSAWTAPPGPRSSGGRSWRGCSVPGRHSAPRYLFICRLLVMRLCDIHLNIYKCRCRRSKHTSTQNGRLPWI